MVDVKTASLTVRVPEPLRVRFKVVCAQKGRAMNDVLAEFIEWYTAKEEKA